MIDKLLRELMKNNLPFGGKICIFGGDFHQTLPILEDNFRSPAEYSFLNSKFFGISKKFSFNKIIRQKNDLEYSLFCLKVAKGTLPKTPEGDYSILPANKFQIFTNLDQSIQFLFPNLYDNDSCSNSAFLSVLNDEVDEFNNLILEKLIGKTYKLIGTESTSRPEDYDYLPFTVSSDFLENHEQQGVPPHFLYLKIGAIAFITRNLNPAEGLYNGTKVEILNINNRSIEVRKLKDKKVCIIPKIKFELEISSTAIKVYRRQFPLRLCYAITFNKSQGQTLDRIILNNDSDPFAHGQTYVAFSRVRSFKNVAIFNSELNKITPNGSVLFKNVVDKTIVNK